MREVIDLAQRSGDLYHQMIGWHNLGFFSLRARKPDASIHAATLAARLAERVPNSLLRAMALHNVGSNYRVTGDLESSARFLEEAAAVIEKANLPYQRMLSLNELGLTYFTLDRKDRAISALRQAFVLARQLSIPDEFRRVAGNLAMLSIETGNYEEANQVLGGVLQLIEKHPRLQGRGFVILRCGQLAEAQSRYPRAIELYEEAMRHASAEPMIRWEAHAGLARTHDKLGQPRQAAFNFERALLEISTARAGLESVDHQLSYLNYLIRFYQSYSRWLAARGDDEKAFGVEESSRAQVLMHRLHQNHGAAIRPMTLRALRQATARTRTILLSYWLDSQRPHVRVITPDQYHSVALPAATESIRRWVREYRDYIELEFGDPLHDGHPAGQKLSDALLAPVAHLMPKHSRVIIVPDATLHQLNFETLPAPANGSPRYWIDDVTVSVAPALSVLEEPALKPSARSLLLLGDPVQPGPEFRKLEYAAAEIEAIRERFQPPPVVLRAAEVTPAAYFQARPSRFSHIHFSTHAVALPENPLDSFIVLSPAGADYRLYARTAMETPLNADLVTISACRGAGGRAFTGEGMIGLSWAFLRSGARHVIAGLWDVPDQSTAGLMQHLYDAIAAGAEPAEALRSAKRKLLDSPDNRRKPFYWGPFQNYSRVFPRP
jgi:CHAT domain-containing protein